MTLLETRLLCRGKSSASDYTLVSTQKHNSLGLFHFPRQSLIYNSGDKVCFITAYGLVLEADSLLTSYRFLGVCRVLFETTQKVS